MSDMKLELIVIPVSDVDRAVAFYKKVGWRLDADVARGDHRRVQLTPPGSPCSVMFGKGVTTAPPGSSKFNHLAVTDIVAARAALVAAGVDASGVFHDASGANNRFDPGSRTDGPDPQRRSYSSFALFSDPDGNTWILQEITARLPGRVDAQDTTYSSKEDLQAALIRAAMAHGEHEKRMGAADKEWPVWYAAFMVAEQHGDKPPQ